MINNFIDVKLIFYRVMAYKSEVLYSGNQQWYGAGVQTFYPAETDRKAYMDVVANYTRCR